MKLRLGTRSSTLAVAQAELVKALIEATLDYEVEVITSSSIGDRDLKSRLTRFRGQGVFTSGLELQLLDDKIDLAVHSLKDLPVEDNEGLQTIAYIERHHPGDSIIVNNDDLVSAKPLRFKEGLRFATGSPRRQSQMMSYDPSAVPVDIRGNVETRISRLNTGYIDAVVMASAVFERIDLSLPKGTTRVQLPLQKFPGAAGQGVIAVQVREGTYSDLKQLNHRSTRQAATVERKILDNAGGGCELSLGVYVSQQDGGWQVDATRAQDNWKAERLPELTSIHVSQPTLEGLEHKVQQWFEKHKNADMTTELSEKTVLITRSEHGAEPYKQRLEQMGAVVVTSPVFQFRTNFSQLSNQELLADWDETEWLVVSSQRTRDILKLLKNSHDKPVRVAVTGPKTASVMRSLDFPVHLVSNDGMAGLEVILAEARQIHPGEVLYLHGENYHRKPSDDANSYNVYEAQVSRISIPPNLDYIIVYSRRAAESILHQHGPDCAKYWIAIGPTTGKWLDDQGVPVVTADNPTPDGIAKAINSTL